MFTPQSAPGGARPRRHLPTALLLLLPLLALAVSLSPSAPPAEAGPRADEAAACPDGPPTAAGDYGKLPLQFEANRGQSDERVRFISRGDGYVMFLTAREAVLALSVGRAPERGAATEGARDGGYRVLRMSLAGANANPEVEGVEELPGKINYFVGSNPSDWRAGVPVYGRVRYGGVYPGIDLVYYGNQRELEYDFVVAPGADPRAIRLKFEGAERAEVEKDGSLLLRVGDGELRMKRPVIYQVGDDGGRREVEGGYRVKGSQVEFSVGRYDAGRPLVIDPVLSYSTFLGVVSNLNTSTGPALALDSSGSAYVTGAASLLAFPAPGLKVIPAGSFSSNVFVTKLNPAGSALVYTSYLGGFSDEAGLGIALDSSGAAYVTGRTTSTDFPTVNAVRANDDLIKSADGGATWQPSNAGLQNRPVTRMWADPSSASTLYALTFNGLYKTTDGGAGWARLNTGLDVPGSSSTRALAVAPSNPSVLYAGGNFSPAKVVKSTDGGATWSPPANAGLPGSGVTGLSVDPTNPSVVFAGLAPSSDTYKTTDGGASWSRINTGLNFGGVQNFVFDPTDTQTVYAQSGGGPIYKTTNGGGNWTQATTGITSAVGRALVIDPSSPSTLYAASGGAVYKTTNGAASWTPITNGLTNLTAVSLALDPAAPSTLYAGTSKGGVYKTTDGGANWAQVHSGLSSATVLSLAVSASSQVYAGIDVLVGGGNSDGEAFVFKLGPDGDALVYSTYLGGLGEDEGAAVAVDSSGSAYVVGRTASPDFPAAGPRASSLKGVGDAFVTRFSPAGTSLLFSTLVGGAGYEVGRSVALNAAGDAYVSGETGSSDFPVTPGAFSTIHGGNPPFPGGSDGFVFKIDAAGSALAYATYLGGNGDDRASDIAVDSSGNAYVGGSTNSSNFPTLNAVQPTIKGEYDAFVAALNASGSALLYSTYLGGRRGEFAQSIALDSSGAAYLTGASASINFPVTPDTIKFHSPIYRTTDSGASWDNHNLGLDAGSIAGNPGAFRDLAPDPSTPHVIYAASDDGVYKSTDGGRRWVRSANGLTAQRVNVVVVDPKTPSTVYAGVSTFTFNSPAVFKSTDGGANWSPLPSSNTFQSVSVIAVDPVTPSNVYVSLGNSVVKSTDGGASWSPPGNNSPSSVNSLAIDPSNPSNVYAAANSGVYKTTDGGANWSPAVNGIPNPVAVGRVTLDPAHPSVLYANTTAGVYKTTDGGANWTLSLTASGLSRLLVVDPSDGSTVYAYAGQPSGSFNINYALYRTTDGGAHWAVLHTAPPYPLTALAIDPFTRTNLYVAIDTFTVGDTDAFLLKLAPGGGPVVYSTLLGGSLVSSSNSDQGTAVAVDAQGAAYVAGVSFTRDFPVTAGSFLPYNRSGVDVFVSKLVTAPSIGGVVTGAGGAPQQGVKISLTGSASGTQFTGADGTFLFVNLPAGGNYAVGATKAGFSFTPPSHGFTNLAADQAANFALVGAAASHKIAGRLTEADGSPVIGATVTLNGSQLELATTDAQGNYLFHAPDGGNYTVTPTALGFTFSPPSGAVNNLANDQTLDFTAARQDFVVTNGNDSGAGSLRQAILDANATFGRDRITFNIPGTGVRTISPTTALPVIVEPVTIDGATQPGYAGTPVVELSGAGIFSSSVGGNVAQGSGLIITAGESVVRGLCINRFLGHGIALMGGGNSRIEGNVIGLDPTGAVKRSNGGDGVNISNSSSNVVGGTTPAQRNVISGNSSNGVTVFGPANQIKGNYIGTDISGTQTFSNLGSGNGWGVSVGNGALQVSAANVVGGTEPGARNVISGNQAGGVDAAGAGSVVRGNYIGTDVSGANKLPNGIGVRVSGVNVVVGGTTPEARNVISGNGIGVSFSFFSPNPMLTLKGNYIGTDPTGTLKVGNGTGISSSGRADIGGAEPGAGNLISGNDTHGILIGCCGSGASVVKGNLIGTDASGSQPLGNRTGINIQGSQHTIGGPEPGARNVISGNETGISVGGGISTAPVGNVIRGNLIGTDASGVAPLPNRLEGINLFDTSNTSVGGDAAGEGNTIAFNGLGVLVWNSSLNNPIKGNSIFSNVSLGLDLLDNFSGLRGAVTPNDGGDADEGGNRVQNFPVISGFSGTGGGTNVRGSLDGKPGTQFRLDFYSNLACDASGHGEGARPLGSAQVTTDAGGAAAFDVTLPAQLAEGRVVTATATDPAGNTSEFSPCDASAAAGSVEFSALDYHVLEDVGAVVVRVVRTGGSRGTLTVNYTAGGGTATAGADYTPASGQFTFAEGETQKTLTIPVADDGLAEPEETVVLSLSGTPELESLGGKSRATLHIFDAATPLTLAPENLSSGAVAFAEGNAGKKNVVVTISLNAATGRTVTVDYNTLGFQATSGVDFLPVAGTLTFAPGEMTRDILIPVVGDAVDEFNEAFFLELKNPSGATVIFPQFDVLIVDDDEPPSASVTDVTVIEAAGAKAAFAVRLSRPTGKSVTVTYSTADGTAAAGSDYAATSGNVTFAPGQTVKIVEVAVSNDGAAEGEENFSLNIASTNQTRATVADAQGRATVLDSSSASSLVQFAAASYAVGEADGQAQVTVSRSGDTSQAAAVDYATVSQSADERADFTAAYGTLRFAPDETQKTFTVLVTDDRYQEAAESLDLVLSNAAGAALGGPSVVALTINSNDASDGPSPVGGAAFDSAFFVRMHYRDFLHRDPDQAGLDHWVNQIESCGADSACRQIRRVNVSAAFFLSIEFQETGYLAYRTFKAAYGDATSPNVPGTVPVIRLREFLSDSQRIGQGVQVGIGEWVAQLAANKQAYMAEFVTRQRFTEAFPLTLSAEEFVDKLNQNAGGVLSQEERDALVAELAAAPDQTLGRADALRRVSEDDDLKAGEKNRAFVLMQYYGYMRRNPDDPQDTDFGGWRHWLSKLEEFNGNFVRAEMVRAFITSFEYTERFGR